MIVLHIMASDFVSRQTIYLQKILPCAYLCILFIGYPAVAQSISTAEKCDRQSSNTAEFKNCMAGATSRDLRKLRGSSACSENSCIHRLSCELNKFEKKCSGLVYDVTFRSEQTGSEIIISQKGGGATKFFQCGSCSGLEYVSGPLKSADIQLLSNKHIVLEVPK